MAYKTKKSKPDNAEQFALEIFNTYQNWNKVKPRADDYLIRELQKLHMQIYPPALRGEKRLTVILTQREASALIHAAALGVDLCDPADKLDSYTTGQACTALFNALRDREKID